MQKSGNGRLVCHQAWGKHTRIGNLKSSTKTYFNHISQELHLREGGAELYKETAQDDCGSRRLAMALVRIGGAAPYHPRLHTKISYFRLSILVHCRRNVESMQSTRDSSKECIQAEISPRTNSKINVSIRRRISNEYSWPSSKAETGYTRVHNLIVESSVKLKEPFGSKLIRVRVLWRIMQYMPIFPFNQWA